MPQQIDPRTLTRTIRSRFSLSEIDDLCFDLDIPHEDVAGETRREKARELVQYCERRSRLPELAQRVAELRPTAETAEPSDMTHKNNQTERTRRAAVWVPIIVALIGLVGVIITTVFNSIGSSSPTPTSPQTTETPADTASFDYPVTVRDNDTEQPISGAHVIIETGGGFAPKNGFTDSNGFVRITIDAELVGTKGRLSIEATGYQRFTQEIDLILAELPDEVRLIPE